MHKANVLTEFIVLPIKKYIQIDLTRTENDNHLTSHVKRYST